MSTNNKMFTAENITYFIEKGNGNFENVINTVKEYLSTDSTIKNVAVFAGKTASALKLHEELKDFNVHITVATYPFGRKFNKMGGDERELIIPDITTKEAREEITDAGMDYIQGGLPFEPILSTTGDNSTEMIISAYETISKGLPHCISAAVMACENGIVEEDEKILALAGDTAILVTPTIRRELFCGDFKIHKILCKPL